MKDEKIVLCKNMGGFDWQDIVYLEKQARLYEDSVDSYRNDDNYVKLTKRIVLLRNKAGVEARRRDKEKKALEVPLVQGGSKEENSAWSDLVNRREIYFVVEESKYYEYVDSPPRWIVSSADGAYMSVGAFSNKDKIRFKAAMSNNEKIKKSAAFSFKHVSADILDLTRRDCWLQPKDGDVHPIFDILLESLGGGRRGGWEHIEQLLYWKYTHPEDHQIPCLCITGVGGVGKNQYFEGPLAQIFGSGHVAVLGANLVFGDHNGLIANKTAVLVNEISANTSYTEKAKEIVGSAKVGLNKKYGKQDSYENTPLYVLAGNSYLGAMILDGTASDRRWSIIIAEHNIMFYIRKHFQFELVDPILGVQEDEQQAIDWWRKNEQVLHDPEQVARWLGRVVRTWSASVKQTPLPLHGEDYNAIRSAQMTYVDEFCEMLFLDDSFTHIRSKTAWTLFLAWKGGSGRKKVVLEKKKRTLEKMKNWVEKNADHVKCEVKFSFDRLDGERTTGLGFSKDGGTTWGDEVYLMSESSDNTQPLVTGKLALIEEQMEFKRAGVWDSMTDEEQSRFLTKV